MKVIIVFIIITTFFIGMIGICFADGSFEPVVGKPRKHTVKATEDLYDIGLMYHLAIDHLMMANQITTLKVPAGTVLTLPVVRILPATLPEGLVLNLPERMLYVFKDSRMIAWYPVAIGAPGKWMTPVGDVKIVNKAKNPTWLPPEWAEKEDPVGPGPDNPLGERWIGLSLPGYGFHATNAPLTIGMATSHGCLRMNPRDAKELFEQVKVGMDVKIVYEPILIGRSPESGMILLSVYPDVYGKVPDMRAALAGKLNKYGILNLVDAKKGEEILTAQKGIPTEIVGIDIAVKVNNRTLELSFPPLMKNGKLLVVSEIVPAIGATMRRDEDNKVIEIIKDDKKVLLSYDEASPDRVFTWKGKTLLPLREVLEGIGMSIEWDSKNHTVSILGVTPEHISPVPDKEKNAGTREDAGNYNEKVRQVEERF